MDDHDESLRRAPIIEANGAEYLITLNGSVFLALSLAAAERIADRMAGRGRSGPRPGSPPADVRTSARAA